VAAGHEAPNQWPAMWTPSGIPYGSLHATECIQAFSIAFTYAIAAAARCTISELRSDVETVDYTVRQVGDHRHYSSSMVDVQMKCTSQNVLREDGVHFPLKRRHYDALYDRDRPGPGRCAPDQAGTFEPKIARKRQRRLIGVEDPVVSLAAKSLTTGEVQTHPAEIHGTKVARQTAIIDKVVEEWRNRPLDPTGLPPPSLPRSGPRRDRPCRQRGAGGIRGSSGPRRRA
jgi:hypothetical protein